MLLPGSLTKDEVLVLLLQAANLSHNNTGNLLL